jgi:predicted ATP-dependent protease
MLCVVLLLFHKYELAKLTFNFTESLWQKVVEDEGVIVGDVNALTVTETAEEVALQPLVSITFTEYFPEVNTVML